MSKIKSKLNARLGTKEIPDWVILLSVVGGGGGAVFAAIPILQGLTLPLIVIIAAVGSVTCFALIGVCYGAHRLYVRVRWLHRPIAEDVGE